MYKYNSFYEIYLPQLLKTRALKSEKPKAVGFYQTQAIQNPSLDLRFTMVKVDAKKALKIAALKEPKHWIKLITSKSNSIILGLSGIRKSN